MFESADVSNKKNNPRVGKLETQRGIANWAKLHGLIETHRHVDDQLTFMSKRGAEDGEILEIAELLEASLNAILDFKASLDEARRERAIYLVALLDRGDQLQTPQLRRLLNSVI
jgi:hypothetical protein